MSLSEQHPHHEKRGKLSHEHETAHNRFLAVMQASTDVFWLLTPLGEMREASDSWQSFTGQQEGDWFAWGWLSTFHPADLAQVEETLRQVLAFGHIGELTCHIRGHDDTYHLLHMRAIPVREADGTIREIIVCGTDLTRQSQAQQMSETQTQLALKASRVGMWDWDLTTGELIWTDQKRALFGMPADAPISYERFLQSLHPDDRERVRQLNIRAMTEKKEYNKDYRVIWPDGSVHWLADRAQGILDASGKLIHIVGATLDITELKCKEEQLQAANQKVTTILESITDAFLHIDTEWRYTYVNRRMEDLLGKSRNEVLGRLLWEVVPELLGTPFEYHYRRVMEARQVVHFEAFHPVFKRWVDTSVYPTQDGLSIYFHDIHERKQAEEALRESNERFQRFIDSNIIGIIITDMEGNICEANDAFLSLIGYTQEDLEAGRMLWSTITSPKTQEQDIRAIDEALREGIAQPYEKEYVTKDGKRVSALIGRVLYRREETSPLFICFALDLSAQKAIDRQKDLFLGMTGHELKTPLAALRGTLQLVQRRLKRVDKVDYSLTEWERFVAGLKKSLENAVRQIDIQTNLINDLLDVSRITTNTLKLSLNRCELGDIIRETVEDIRVIAPERSLLLELPEHTPVYVLADRDRISQVITNYVTNAIRYSSPNQPIIIGMSVQETAAHAWVSDKGPGLSEQAQKDIWQCFHQAEGIAVQSGSGKGLGLGLYICRILIEQHHGEVGVESTPGQGSTFWFSLPTIT